jgi:3-oxoacyl-(acyl-carrier-protein) synthase
LKRVVITGVGIVSPIGTGKMDFLYSLKNGKSGIKYISELAYLNFNCNIGGVPETNGSATVQLLGKYNLSDVSSTIHYALIAGLEAWEDAGLRLPDYNAPGVDPDTGVIVGSGIGSMDIISDKLITRVNERKHLKIKSSTVEQLLFSASGAYLSGILSAGNLVSANSNACSTGTEAILLGFEHIRQGKAKRMVVGSTEGYSPHYWAAFDALRVTATIYNDLPEKGSRPMSASACGMIPAAGSGILILEEFDFAIERKARIYAEIAGGFLNCGGQRNGGTMTAPNPSGVIRCIMEALRDANIRAQDVDCISGHLSSTMADTIEIKNWTTALKRKGKDFPFINSLKSMTGHCLGATGAIETIAASLEINGQFIHPSINCEDVHPEIAKMIDVNKIPMNFIENADINYLAKTSFGFGDVNACIILKRFQT